MALPRGEIVHRTSGRIRIRFPDKKKDPDFFQDLAQSLKENPKIVSLRCNPLTASLLLEGDFSDIRPLAAYAESRGLFLLDPAAPERVPLRQKVYQSYAVSNRFVQDSTRQELDLPVLIFLMLAGTGIYQLFRSEVRLPPWYSALWYALGIFTKSLSDLDTIEDGGE